MIRDPLVMACCCDLSGVVKGKAFPAADLDKRRLRGIGWVPTNAQITAFNSISDTPFGALGDLALIPDPTAEVHVDFGDASPVEHWFLGDIHEMDGRPWACCPRSILRAALERLERVAGLRLIAAFEMEMQFRDHDDATDLGSGFSMTGFRARQGFGETFIAALRAAGVRPDSFLREWGPAQYEMTMHPEPGLRAADCAVIMREIARATALRTGNRVTFTPVLEAGGVGNGLHIHMSLTDLDGMPVTHDPAGTAGLGAAAGAFVAGILNHLPSLTAFTAPSVVSYGRLIPHRWSAAFTNLGHRDREASVRICPHDETPGADIAGQYHFEVRACDNAASPYLQLAALVHAGCDGIERGLLTPMPTEEDLSDLSDADLAARGLRRLASSLDEALDLLDGNETVRRWFDDPFIDVYLKHKRGEIAHVAGLDEADLHAAYAAAY